MGLMMFFFFKQKTAYEMRISDWSSDVCSSDLDYQQCTQAYDALMQKATRDAFAIFEDKLAEREEPGRQIQSARALFDLWVDAAEDAYAKIALSHEFREV